MPSLQFSSCKRCPDGYPPYVLGWFGKARTGTMQRGYRDVGYLLSHRLRRFHPRWLSREAWRYHIETLRESLVRRDERGAFLWFAVTYPGLVSLVPVGARRQFVAGLREKIK